MGSIFGEIGNSCTGDISRERVATSVGESPREEAGGGGRRRVRSGVPDAKYDSNATWRVLLGHDKSVCSRKD